MREPSESKTQSRTVLTLSEAAEILRLTRSTVLGLIRRGELEGFQIGGRGQWRLQEADLWNYVNHRKAEQALAIATEPEFSNQAPT